MAEKTNTHKKKISARALKIKRLRFVAKAKSGPLDLPFLLIIMVLQVFGIVMMFSASYVWAVYDVDATGGDGAYYVKRQIFFAISGILGMLFLSYLNYHFFQRKKVVLFSYFGSLFLLILVPFVGVTRGGATRWLDFGFVQFQPSEFMKLGIIISFAYLITKNYKRIQTFKFGILPFLILLAPVIILMMMQPHLSGTIIICLVAMSMVFTGGAKLSHFFLTILSLAAAIAAVVVYKIQSEGLTYITKRFDSWLDPFSDMLDSTWQTCQSLIAIGSGGIFGLGLGNSRQKYLYLPETKNDFVFSIVCEELGFIGAMIVIILFILFIFRGLYIASKACDKLGSMLAVGLTLQIGIQAFINIGVVTNALPNTGISLPFFSYGGTALVIQLWEMGILLNISRQSLIEN